MFVTVGYFFSIFPSTCADSGCHDTQHNDIQHNGIICDTQHNNALPLCWVPHFIHCYAECHYAEGRYAECHSVQTQSLAHKYYTIYNTTELLMGVNVLCNKLPFLPLNIDVSWKWMRVTNTLAYSAFIMSVKIVMTI